MDRRLMKPAITTTPFVVSASLNEMFHTVVSPFREGSRVSFSSTRVKDERENNTDAPVDEEGQSLAKTETSYPAHRAAGREI